MQVAQACHETLNRTLTDLTKALASAKGDSIKHVDRACHYITLAMMELETAQKPKDASR